jgi:hypothetical protein
MPFENNDNVVAQNIEKKRKRKDFLWLSRSVESSLTVFKDPH